MPENDIFEGIGYQDVNDYLSSAVNIRESKVYQLFSNLREASRNAGTFEEAEKLAIGLNRFAMQLDPKNEKHRNFYNNLEGAFIDNLSKEFRECSFYDNCPTVNKINYILLSCFSIYTKLAQTSSLNKIPPQLQENLLAAPYSTFENTLPFIYNAECNDSLRNKINDTLVYQSNHSANNLLANLKTKFHNFKTLKKLDDSIFKEKVKEILEKDALLYKLTQHNGALPDTLSGRFDLFLKTGDFQTNKTTLKLANELAFADIRDGKAEKLGADKIAVLLASDVHLGYLTEKISLEKLNQVFNHANKHGLNIARTVRDKFFNQELAAAKDWNKILNMTRYKDDCSGSRSSVKDYQTRFEIAAQKITEIKNSQEYAFMTADIQEYEKRAAGLKEIYENSSRLSGCIGYLERIQALSENVLKNFSSQKDAGLSGKDLEKAAGNALNNNFEPLAHTNARLPFLFGRKEEKRRQQALNNAVDQFNKILKELSADKNTNRQIKNILLSYSGKLLEKSTLEALKNSFQETRQEINRRTDDLNYIEKNWNIRQKKMTLEEIAASEKAIMQNADAAGKEKDRRLSEAKNRLKEKTGIDTAEGKSGVVKADKIAAEVIRAKKSNGK